MVKRIIACDNITASYSHIKKYWISASMKYFKTDQKTESINLKFSIQQLYVDSPTTFGITEGITDHTPIPQPNS